MTPALDDRPRLVNASTGTTLPRTSMTPSRTGGAFGRGTKGLLLPLLIVVAVMGRIYGGFPSVTESAGLGVPGVLSAVWVRGEFSRRMLWESLTQTVATCGAVLWLVFGANALIGAYNLMGGIGFTQKRMKGLDLPPFGMVVVIMVTWVVLGAPSSGSSSCC